MTHGRWPSRIARGCPLALGLLLAACSSGTIATASPTESATTSPGPAAVDCHPLDLRLPDGQRLDLTGTWEGGSTLHYVRQFEDCVWWSGLSNYPPQPLGAWFTVVFSGHLGADFTLSGVEATIVTPSAPGLDPLRQVVETFMVDFAGATSAEPFVLSPVEADAQGACGCPLGTLHYVGPLPASVGQ